MNQEQRIHPTKSTNSSVPRKFQVDDFDQKAIFLCQFCGGVDCKRENYLTNKFEPNAIKGLNSNWITKDILAMQRPSERLIKQFGLYEKFKENNIRTVLNLQQPGEHPYCGDGIIPNIGFSYIPENFYSQGIRCFNQSWEDMTATTFEHMMKIMNLFDLTISEGSKISVHCHAGIGRTLLAICSWLIYHDRMPAQTTISLAQQKREGALSGRNQRNFLFHFQKELEVRWRSYGIEPTQKTFSDFVQWQSESLLNKEKRKLQKKPIVHLKLLSLLRKFLDLNTTKTVKYLLSPDGAFQAKWIESSEGIILSYKRQMNSIKFDKLQEEEEDTRIVSQLFFDFYEELPYTLLTSLTVQSIQQLLHTKPQSSRLALLLEPAIVHDIGISGLAVLLDVCHFLAKVSAKINKNMAEKQSEIGELIGNNPNLMHAFYCKMALMFLSKRKFFPRLYPPHTSRNCMIHLHIQKIDKLVNPQILFLAQFMKVLSKELPEEIEDLQRLVFRACKVDSNLYYLKKQSPQLLTQAKKQQIYDNARISNI